MTRLELLIGIMFAITAAYPIIMRLLADWAQPKRLRMADLGNELLNNEALATSHRGFVNSMLTDAFDPRVAVVLTFALPVFVIGKFFDLISEPAFDDLGMEEKKKLNQLSALHTRSVLAANPIFFIIMALELVILTAILVPFKLFKGSLDFGNSIDLNAYAAAHGKRFINHSAA